MRVVGYARVSTNGQAVHGVSVPEQKRAPRAWCEAQGHELVGVEVDNGLSGRLPIEQRPGLAAALLAVECREAGGLVVRDLDRLARKLHIQEAVLAKAWDAGGRVFETSERGEVLRDDPSDPYRTFVRQVMGAASQLEAGLARMRLQRGRSLKHERGGYAGGHTIAFGERVEGVGRDAVRVAIPEATIVVERIRQLRDADLSFAAIAEHLDAEGVPTARGGHWHAMSVRRVIERCT